MDFIVVFSIAVVVIALCLLGMAVGVILRGKSFRSCGGASLVFRGEKIKCPGCVEDDGEASVDDSRPVGCRHAREPDHASAAPG